MDKTTRTEPGLVPVRAQLQGANAEQADNVDDWAGRRARAVMAGRVQLPEMAAEDDDGEDRDGFDPDTMSGEVEAYPSVMGRPYRMGFFTWHQLEPGCFDEFLADEGGKMPIYVQHSWDWSERPPIGHIRTTEETDFSDDEGDTRALYVTGRIYPDVPDGLAVLHSLAAGALREWSITYLIEEWTAEEDEDNGRQIIHVAKAQIWEGSVVLRGANPWQQTLEVASAPTVTEDERSLTLDEFLATVSRHGMTINLAAGNGGGSDGAEPPPEELPAAAEDDGWVAELAGSSPSFRRALGGSDPSTRGATQ